MIENALQDTNRVHQVFHNIVYLHLFVQSPFAHKVSYLISGEACSLSYLRKPDIFAAFISSLAERLLTMRLRRPLLIFEAWGVVAQYNTLQDILNAQSATLSTLSAWLQSQAVVFQILSNAQGVTLLAPSNNALTQLYSTSLASELALDPNFLTAFLAYHVLSGVHFVSDLSKSQGASVPTFLNMAAYSNVSGGQVVHSKSQNGAVNLITGNNMQSNLQPYVFPPITPSLQPIERRKIGIS